MIPNKMFQTMDDEEEELHVPKLNEDDEFDNGDDSDRELQVAFASGLLKPGLVRPINAPPVKINNEEGLKQKLEEIKQDLNWFERLDVTVETNKDNSQAEGEELDVHNDFKREVVFYEQAQASVLIALGRLHEANIPTKRPDDYFAEMAKKDDHMKKLRTKILALQKRKEAAEKNRANFQLRKFGKQVQQQVTMERQSKKKQILNSVKKFQKGRSKNLDFLDEDDDGKKGKSGKDRGNKQTKTSQLQQLQEKMKLNPKRTQKNKKYGYGGQKRNLKSNNKNSANNVSGFRKNIHSKKLPASGKNKRLGKSRRAKAKR